MGKGGLRTFWEGDCIYQWLAQMPQCMLSWGQYHSSELVDYMRTQLAVRSQEPYRLQCDGSWQCMLCRGKSPSSDLIHHACAQVAVRSEEPYRLQCYGFLAAAAAPDILGIASVARPVLPVLDALYATRATLERLVDKHGPRAQRCALLLKLLPRMASTPD